MNHFSIRDIENLSGIKAHTLRIWEQRFQLCCPKRKSSKHRIYDNEDLKHILRIAFLYNNGYKISRIAAMSDNEIEVLALESKQGTENCEIFINQLMEASVDFNESAFESTLNACLLHFGFEKTMQTVMFPLLRKIGLLWLTGHIIPAQEHFASSLIINKIMMAIDGLDKPLSNSRKVLLFTPAGEHHEIPTLFMLYLLRKEGVAAIFLGKNVDTKSIAAVGNAPEFTELYFHLITNLAKYDIEEFITQLKEACPGKEIYFSLSDSFRPQPQFSSGNYLASKEDMLRFVKAHPVLSTSH